MLRTATIAAVLSLVASAGIASPAPTHSWCEKGEIPVFFNEEAKTAIQMDGSEAVFYFDGKRQTFPTGSVGTGISARLVSLPSGEPKAIRIASHPDGDILILGDEAYFEDCLNPLSMTVATR